MSVCESEAPAVTFQACITNVWRWCYLIEHRVQWSQRSIRAMSVGFTVVFISPSLVSCVCVWWGGGGLLGCMESREQARMRFVIWEWNTERVSPVVFFRYAARAGWLLRWLDTTGSALVFFSMILFVFAFHACLITPPLLCGYIVKTHFEFFTCGNPFLWTCYTVCAENT